MQNKPNIDAVRKAIPSVHIHDEIGEGGFKVAFRASVAGEKEALKIIQIPFDPSDASVAETNLRRAYREIEILGQCKSNFLVKLGSFRPEEVSIGGWNYVCYSEEIIEGESLRTRIRDGQKPPIQELASVGRCMLEAVVELESLSQPVVHRDIKPENIIAVGSATRPFVLLDMGIAFVAGATNLTQIGAIPGSRYYKAPEMFEANFRDKLDSRADIYTIGLTLYEYASNENPFFHPQDHEYNTVVRILNNVPNPLCQLRPDLDSGFCELIDQMMSKMPALRPGNTALLKKRMENWV